MKTILSLIVVILSCATLSNAFTFVPSTKTSVATSTSLEMGLFDGISKAFSNEEYAAPPEGIKATARHILVKTPEEINTILEQIGTTPFANLAQQYSTCPSGARGGSLGSFSPGTMVKAFDEVVFNKDTNIGEVVGPVQTQFGYHLIVVDKRTGV
uniref:Peptidyl-prolyl cis-trans isomerase n=1 Tax=Ditylum brightwellii TaxID=49249 RepID=A0A7S1ZCK2_9STRA|mmetsp:Transcript_28888/g.42951  ORF Transcript_28888/g.42951 Transcript_28888/m.42951 type:complete len:155 (+) Transcript_28888:149-613(+)